MIKHFEHLWEQGESTIKTPTDQVLIELDLLVERIEKNIDKEFIIGQILLRLCALSNHYQINTFTALKNAITDYTVSEIENANSADFAQPNDSLAPGTAPTAHSFDPELSKY